MDFMKLLGAVLAVCYHPGSTSKVFSGQRICRRGTERPCYKIAYFPDERLRVSFELARQTCQNDDGELLSIETENEQRLVERFVQELRATDGDFWLGMRRSQRYRGSHGIYCSSLYTWLDNSEATFRNWLWNEPSCGHELCVSLYHRPSVPLGQWGSNMFKWHDENCNKKNNFICKYSEEKLSFPPLKGNATAFTENPVMSVMTKHPSVTVDHEKIKTGLSGSSVSVLDDTLNVYYILLATIPVLLLLLLVASGVFCFRVMSRRRKEQNDRIYAQPGNFISAGSPNKRITHIPTPIYSQPGADLHYMCPEIKTTSSYITSNNIQCEDYENVTGDKESGFVTNAIYESCRGNRATETGWVENEIYGY
ncbi:layilin [Chanos chanos]|uniref:Layilin n=1 Tax=Chanos chanos TaxID=29144 RepID=A0A6J2VNH1_CHACN|nr:layilin-like [Chanos chanos]